MRSRRWPAVVAGMGLMLAGAAPAADGLPGKVLTGAEIRAALLGNTAYGRAPSGERWTMWIAPDGKMTVRGTTLNGTMFGDFGTGVVEGDRWCVVWEQLREGRRACLTVRQDGETFRNYAADGHLESTYTIRPGNAEGM